MKEGLNLSTNLLSLDKQFEKRFNWSLKMLTSCSERFNAGANVVNLSMRGLITCLERFATTYARLVTSLRTILTLVSYK